MDVVRVILVDHEQALGRGLGTAGIAVGDDPVTHQARRVAAGKPVGQDLGLPGRVLRELVCLRIPDHARQALRAVHVQIDLAVVLGGDPTSYDRLVHLDRVKVLQRSRVDRDDGCVRLGAVLRLAGIHRPIALCRASDRTRLGLDQERPRLVGHDHHPVEVGIRRRHTEDRLLLHRENGPALRVELPEGVARGVDDRTVIDHRHAAEGDPLTAQVDVGQVGAPDLLASGGVELRDELPTGRRARPIGLEIACVGPIEDDEIDLVVRGLRIVLIDLIGAGERAGERGTGVHAASDVVGVFGGADRGQVADLVVRRVGRVVLDARGLRLNNGLVTGERQTDQHKGRAHRRSGEGDGRAPGGFSLGLL